MCEKMTNICVKGKGRREMALLSEGSSVKENPEDKQACACLCQGKCQDFTAGHSGTLHWTIFIVVNGTHFS